MQYKGVEIPEKFIEIAVSKGLKQVGNYNGREHKFFTPLLNPNNTELSEIKSSFEEYGLFPERDEFNAVYKQIRNNLSDEPSVNDVNSLNGTELFPYDHVVFVEDDGSETDTIFVGDSSFFVLSTTKSSLQNADVIRCISMPMSVHDREKFTIYREGKEFVPMDVKYPPTFCTNPVASIKILRSPFLYAIIDGDERFGGRKIDDAKGDLREEWLNFYEQVKEAVLKNEPDSLPDKDVFPGYEELLAHSKAAGIGSYILNLLIENIELRAVHSYCYNADEWEIDPRQKKLDYNENQKKAATLYAEKSKELDNLLKNLKQRRILLLFKASAKVTPAVHQAIDNIISDMDGIADDAVKNGYSGVGTKGTAKAKYDQAQAATKPERFENLKTGGILLAAVSVAVFIGLSWYYSEKNKEVYMASEANVMSRLENSTDFDAMRSELDSIYFSFKPSYTRMLVVRGNYVENQMRISDAKEAHIDKMVSNINTMLKASRGRFNKYSEEALFKLLKVAPDDPRSLELKEKWMNN